jgi:hypothetical protein
MTGFITLHADPTAAMHAATKQYVDANSGGDYLPLTGGDLTGMVNFMSDSQIGMAFLNAAGSTTGRFSIYREPNDTTLNVYANDIGLLMKFTNDGDVMVGRTPRLKSQIRNVSHSNDGPPADMQPGDIHLQYGSAEALPVEDD